MTGGKPTVLVLWGNYFDECAATTIICALRDEGVRVRLVGMDGRMARGRHGLVLATDVSLERALADKQPITHVIVPCSELQWQAMQGNTHAATLVQQLAKGGAILIVPSAADSTVTAHTGSLPGASPTLPLPALRTWPPGVEAAEIAHSLIREITM
jgi:hypothetical protein